MIDDHTTAYLAYDKTFVAGYMILNRKVYKENPFREGYEAIHIDQICVDGDYKGKGIGKTFVDFVKDHARSLNIPRIEMNYWTKNNNSGDVFRSQGFESYNERLAFKL